MSNSTNSIDDMTDRDFVITRTFNAPRSLVFQAWTDPKHLLQWWGPRAFSTPICELDLRVGGAHRIVMRSVDGVDYPIKGVFIEIVAPERLVMTFDASEHPAAWHDMVKPDRLKGDENPAGIMLQTVTFEDVGGNTKLTIRTRFDTVAIRDAMLKMGMTEGWSQSLERLEELLTKSSEATVKTGPDQSRSAKEPGASSSLAEREIVTNRVFDAPRSLVFDAWTNPVHVAKWWGPNGFTNTIHEMDVRPGGVWRFIMHGPDGTDYQNKNVFMEVVRPEKIVFMHVSGPIFQMTVTFDEQDGKTSVTMRMLFNTAQERDTVVKVFGAVEGAKQTLGRLAEFLLKGRVNS